MGAASLVPSEDEAQAHYRYLGILEELHPNYRFVLCKESLRGMVIETVKAVSDRDGRTVSAKTHRDGSLSDADGDERFCFVAHGEGHRTDTTPYAGAFP